VAAVLFLCGATYFAAQWRYAGSIETLEHRLKLRDDRIAEFDRKLSGASPDEAKAKIDSLEAALRSITEREWPALSDRASQILRDRLQAFGPVQVILIVKDRDGRRLARSLEPVFAQIGWPVGYDNMIGAIPDGILIRAATGNAGSSAEQAKALGQVLREHAGISVGYLERAETYGDLPNLDILIGIKPD
jgi:hypothetical protein